MFGVELSPGREFGLVYRCETLLLVPPGAAAVEVGANIGRADDVHKVEYSTNFLKISSR